jgi:hypothetical protein
MLAHPSTTDIALNRALDNVLPHIAYRHFSQPSDGLTVVSEGSWCFRRFVNSYVNSDQRYALLPGADTFHGRAFIALWQSGSTLVKDAGRDDHAIDFELLWDRFLYCLGEYSQQWSSFLRIELGDEVAEHFQTRVPAWQDAVQSVLPRIAEAVSPLSSRKDVRAEAFRDLFVRELRSHETDLRFRQDAERNRVHLAEYSMAVAFNIFQRGALYSRLGRLSNLSTSLFPLRDAASVTGAAASDFGSSEEVDWGNILETYLTEGLIRRDAGLFSDILREIRLGVKANGAFEQRMQERKGAADPLFRATLLKEAVLEILLDSRSVLPSPHNLAVSARLAKVAQNLAMKGKMVQSFVLELVSGIASSRFATEVEIRVRKARGRDKLWKVFRIPGLP